MRVVSRVDRYWLLILGGFATLVQVLSVSRALSNPGHPAINIDSAFFQHAGWYVTQGAIPYLDIWDIKPPLTIETTTVFSILTGGNPETIHLLSVVVTAGAAVGCSLLVGVLAYRLTENSRAALLSGLTLLTLPGFYYLSANGFRPKYLTLFFGLAALVFGCRRPLLAGMAAAASAGYWQYGVIFAFLVVGIAVQNRDRRALARQILGMALVTAVVLSPIVVWGALVPMLVEVLYVPLTSQEAQPLVQRLGKLVFYLAYALVPVAIGTAGLLVRRDRLPRDWWVYAGVAWGGFQLLFDLDSAPDLYILVVFLALGVALFTERARPQAEKLLVAGILGIVMLNALWVGGVVVNPVGEGTASAASIDNHGTGENLTKLAESVDVSRPGAPPRHGIPGVRKLYWNTRIPPSCHYRLSETERDWLTQTNQPYDESRCGTLNGLG